MATWLDRAKPEEEVSDWKSRAQVDESVQSPSEDPSPVETYLASTIDNATWGVAKAGGGLVYALQEKLKGRPESIGQLHSEYIQDVHKGYRTNPIPAMAGTVTGAVTPFAGLKAAGLLGKAASPLAQKLLTPIAAPTGEGAGVAAGRVASTAANTAPIAAASGFATSESPDIKGKLEDAIMAGAIGGGFGGVSQGMGEVWRGAKGLLGRLLRTNPTEAAKLLQREGVKGMTAGQVDPESVVGRLEEASSHNPLGLEPQRRAAMENAREVAVRKAMAPGATPVEGTIQQQLQAALESFEPAYAKIKGEAIYPAVHGKGIPLQSSKSSKGAFDLAIQNDDIPIDDATRQVAKRFLDNQLSILPGGTVRPPMLQQVDASDLLKMRSNIRTASRGARAQNKGDLAHILDIAEQSVTESIKTQLSPEASAHLKNTDRQYRLYKMLEDASGRATVGGEFTPAQLLAAVKGATGKSATGRGQGGEIQDFAEAFQRVFGTRIPLTGARGLALTIPGVPRLAVPISRIANMPSVRSGTVTQISPSPARTVPMLQALRDIAGPQPRLASAFADDEENQ